VKVNIGCINCLYPMPTTLVGALVNGKPNYLPIAHVGIMDLGSVSLGMGKAHFTNAGIKANGTFRINIPSEKMIKKTDYCGLVSGRTEDKASLFKTFYGKLKTAPMIEECSINMECELIKTVDFPSHDVFVGKIVNTFSDDDVLSGGSVDFAKVKPLLFVMNDRSYWSLGSKLAKAWDIGKELGNEKRGV
jgi:flavin reductase (DIM6/NTAB) family NADH-FMN oxidoreductase RutF